MCTLSQVDCRGPLPLHVRRVVLVRTLGTMVSLAGALFVILPMTKAHATEFGSSTVLRVPQDYPTIAAALAVATDGVTVEIDCGTYNEHTLTIPSGVTVTSVTGLPACVTIDPEQEGPSVFIINGDTTTILRGITVANARAFGGAAVSGSGSPTIRNCFFVGNGIVASAVGGAVNLGGAPRFENCVFDNNLASSGGAVTCSGGVFLNCIFSSNTATELDGGAIDGTVNLIDGCTFKFNYAYLNGGAIHGCVDAIRNSVFWNNGVASHLGAGGAARLNCDADVENCTFYGNSFASTFHSNEVGRSTPITSDVGGAALALAGSSTLLAHLIVANSKVTDVPGATVIACLGSANVQVSCSNIHGTVGAANWSGCVAGKFGLDGNISEDPLFCEPVNGDFALAWSSPSRTAHCGMQGALLYGCPTAVDDPTSLTMLRLHQNVPNPFNPTTQIRLDVPDGGADVQVVVYDVTGRELRTLVRGRLAEGTHVLTWDGKNDEGNNLPSGIYFCRLTSGTTLNVKKMVLLK